MKKLLIALAAGLFAVAANTSQAALGWTPAECSRHWGKSSGTSVDGARQFYAPGYRIVVYFTNGRVARAAYQSLYTSMSESSVETILKANQIDPLASWSLRQKDEGTQTYEWHLGETDDDNDTLALALFEPKQNIVIVFTRGDNDRAKKQAETDATNL
jgi:hypothetical protein